MIDSANAWVALGGGLVAVVAGLVALVRWVRAASRAFADFLEDWRGEAGRPGVPARPGVMERLAAIDRRVETVDDRVQAVDVRLRAVEHELYPNSGGSIRDALNRVDRRTRHAIPVPEEE